MPQFKRQYKEKAYGFGNTSEGRIRRTEKHEELRRNQRTRTFNRNRNITESTSETPQTKNVKRNAVGEDRATKLMKWKAERDRRRKMEMAKKKPPFKVGVVHHKVYSPATKDGIVVQSTVKEKIHTQVEPVSNVSKKITRATQKRLMAKATAVKKAPANKETNANNKVLKKQGESFAPSDHKFRAPSGLPQVPLFGKATLRASTNQISNFILSPMKTNRFSKRRSLAPFSVGKVSPKKEIIKEENVSDTDEGNNGRYLSNTESSIEAVTLKLSSEEEDSQSSQDEGNSTNRNPPLNTSYTKSPQRNDSKLSTPTELKKLNTSVEAKKPDSPGEPALFSPYVVASRGKSNARKEQQLRRGIGPSVGNEIPTKETVMQSLNISVEEEERTAQYFHFILNKEMERLNEVCAKWTEIQEESDTTEDGKYEINQAIGQTNLLMRKKFERFRGLVSDCETGKGEMLVTCKDLQGFWDMMYMEVKDCDSRFDRLEKLRANKWQEEQQPTVINPIAKKKGIKKKKVVAPKQSSLRAVILAARKKKIENNENTDDSNEHTDKNQLNASTVNTEKSTTDVKSRKSESLVGNDTKMTPSKLKNTRMSLLQKVQLSNASKKISSPLAIMKISQMCKTPEVHLDDTVSYVNSTQTPGKSILKRSSESVSRMKSAHKVNFDDNVVLNEVPMDEEATTKMNLTKALMWIDSFDLDNPAEEQVKVERKLTFEDESDDEADDHSGKEDLEKDSTPTRKKKLEVPEIQVEAPTPRSNPHSQDESKSPPLKDMRNRITKSVTVSLVDVMAVSSPNASKHTEKKILEESLMNDTLENVKILRSRVVTSTNTPRHKGRYSKVVINSEESEQKENETPQKAKRKSSLRSSMRKVNIANSSLSLEEAVNQISLEDNNDRRRRSSRRSVKFTTEGTEKECMGCVSSKPVLPMTPHVRRSKSRRSEMRKSAITEDLISWETPEKLPARVKRSQTKKQ